jgi:hypothetical protein
MTASGVLSRANIAVADVASDLGKPEAAIFSKPGHSVDGCVLVTATALNLLRFIFEASEP